VPGRGSRFAKLPEPEDSFVIANDQSRGVPTSPPDRVDDKHDRSVMIVQSWQRLGLRILPHGGARPLGVAIAAGLVFGIAMALADALLFYSVIPESQTALVSRFSAIDRIGYFAPLAVADELIFRLVVMSLLVWALVSAAGQRAWCFWGAILGTALLVYPALHQTYLSSLVLTPLSVLREITLHGGAGILWGYLYWRHGLTAAIAGHVGAHLSLQPLLSLMF